MLFSALSLLLVTATVTPASADHIELERSVLDTTIPKAISDHTAALGGADNDNNMIYIAGGCDDPNGNTWNDEWGSFACGSISSSLYAFNPVTSEIQTLPDMPRQRYRHASVAIANKLWLVGGRSLEDALIEEADVFDMVSQEWTTYTLPAGYASSDLGGWGTETHAFFAGGYDADYTALANVYSIDVAATEADNLLSIVDNGSLNTARGDVAATVNSGKGYAYVSGGFTHENNFCAPLESVERYSLPPGDTWISVASLPTARADKAMVTYMEHTIAMGGERAPDNVCNNVTLSPAEMSKAVDDIEVLNADDSTWQILTTLPEHRFRFAAVVYEDTIYTFGGQQAFDAECNCLKTLDEVVTYAISEEGGEVDTPAAEAGGEDDGHNKADGHTHADGTTHTDDTAEATPAGEASTADENASGSATFQGCSMVSVLSLLVGYVWVA